MPSARQSGSVGVTNSQEQGSERGQVFAQLGSDKPIGFTGTQLSFPLGDTADVADLQQNVKGEEDYFKFGGGREGDSSGREVEC